MTEAAKPTSPAREYIQQALRDARTALEDLMHNEHTLAAIERAAELLCATFRSGGCVYSCGNGGSMSDAMHFAEELTGRFRGNRAGLPAQAISDVGHLSCVANDFGYDQVFARYVLSHGRQGDCLLAISTSGASASVVTGAIAAKERGVKVIALTGRTASELGALADVAIATPGGDYADRAQELHIKVIHVLVASGASSPTTTRPGRAPAASLERFARPRPHRQRALAVDRARHDRDVHGRGSRGGLYHRQPRSRVRRGPHAHGCCCPGDCTGRRAGGQTLGGPGPHLRLPPFRDPGSPRSTRCCCFALRSTSSWRRMHGFASRPKSRPGP